MRPLVSRLFSFVLLAAPLLAQFTQRTMATDMTGSELLFSTVWTLDGETYNPYSKIIRYRAGRLETYRSVPAERDPETGNLTNLPVVILPGMSLDGRRIAFTHDCPQGMVCTNNSPGNTEVRNERDELVYQGGGTFALSANGLWAKNSSLGTVNLETGQTEYFWSFSLMVPGVPVAGRQVANDGTVALGLRSSLVLLKRPGMETEFIELSHVFDTAVMADSGNFAVLQTVTKPWGTHPGLWIFDLRSKTAVPMAIAEEGCHSASLSTDESKVVFLSGADWLATNASHTTQAFLMDLTTGVLNQITLGTEKVTEALITGDGRSVFVRHADGRISLVDIGSGNRTEIIPAVPDLVQVPLVLVPDSRSVLLLSGNRVPTLTVNGVAAKVLEVGDGRVTFIMPEGVADGQHEMLVGFDGSPFQPFKVQVTVRDLSPRFEYWNITPKIWHDSDGTAVYAGSPARSGEVVEVLLSGLGPVDAEGKTLLAMNWKFCHPGQEQPGPIEVLASRKSPYEGEEGLYRVKLRVPQISDAGSGAVSCFDARDETVASGASLAVAP